MNPPSPLQLGLAAAEAFDGLDLLLDGLRAEDWEKPTPCVGWSVRDIVAHVGHVEGMLVHGFPQPEPPPGWEASGSPLDQVTNLGVESRRSWTVTEVVDEVKRVGVATRALLSDSNLDWEEQAITPIGLAPRWTAVEMRVNDLIVHLLDLRTALGQPLDIPDLPTAHAVAVGRAVRLTPWAFVKRVGAGEDESLTLNLEGPGGGIHRIVVTDGRAVVTDADQETDAEIAGAGLAYLVAVTGRHALVVPAGGLTLRGELARRLLVDYRLVG
ncbi:MAG TPA: maleylpyruvate isomerase family mycothiol-dependent enzyme [Acidimicrobiia bacterium]|nr:maleylpyruvate isomerase family mycothiol-dependent enzyme [Acidimicrobiia bacterium]